MADVVHVGNIALLYDNTAANREFTVKSSGGNGSMYTYIASGTAGQSATVEGSADGTIWEHVITLTIDAGKTTQSATRQHVLPRLRVSGNARLQICRGAA